MALLFRDFTLENGRIRSRREFDAETRDPSGVARCLRILRELRGGAREVPHGEPGLPPFTARLGTSASRDGKMGMPASFGFSVGEPGRDAFQMNAILTLEAPEESAQERLLPLLAASCSPGGNLGREALLPVARAICAARPCMATAIRPVASPTVVRAAAPFSTAMAAAWLLEDARAAPSLGPLAWTAPENWPEPGVRRRFGLTSEMALAARNSLLATLSQQTREAELHAGCGPAGEWLKEAAVMLWRDDLFEASLRGCEAFQDTEPNFQAQSAGPQLWFLREGAAGMDRPERLAALSLPETARFLCCYLAPVKHREWGRSLATGLFYVLPPGEGLPGGGIEGAHYPVQPLRDTLRGEFCPFAAALTFLGEVWVGLEPHRYSRQQRKDAERRQKPLPEVYTVQLRRALEKGDRARDGGEGEGRDWSCSWLVAGHWRRALRNTAGPKSAKEYRPVWVRPHQKGDPDKPLREPKGIVYVVSR